MRAFVRLRLPDSRLVDLGPEAVIGRMSSATLRLNDPAISEAHALVSLRGTQLKLLALRGRFSVDGAPVAEVELRPGQSLELGPRITLRVEDVSIPSDLIAIRADGMALQALAPVASVLANAELVPGFAPDAAAILWIDDGAVWLRVPQGEDDQRLEVGEAFDAAGRTFVLERMSLSEAGADATARSAELPVTLRLHYDSVHLALGGRVSSIDGIPGRILCELAELRAPAEWRTVAREVWPHERDDLLLRRNWDAGLARLRRALLECGVRGDLVRASGRGRISLFLGPKDRVVDRQ